MKNFRLGHFKPVLSEVVAAEIENAAMRFIRAVSLGPVTGSRLASRT